MSERTTAPPPGDPVSVELLYTCTHCPESGMVPDRTYPGGTDKCYECKGTRQVAHTIPWRDFLKMIQPIGRMRVR